ncbi:MAG: hypothetical protein KDI67_00270 [Gammaproteobacteria bacterium]|nr:hypothetical protein [Gammaproteobacteria bacterium]
MTRSTDIDNNLIVRAGRALGLAAALGLVLATGSVCAATFQAFSFPSDDQPGNQAYTGGLGNDFDVLSTIRVDSLGVFDDDGDGISGSLTVGIFDLSDVSSGPLVSATISGSDDLLVGSFRFNDVTPLILGPGNYSVVAFGFGADNNANENVADIPLVTNDGGGLIDFVNSRFGTGPFPTTTTVDSYACSGSPEACFGAGTFTFSPVPIPAAAWLFASALGIFGYLGKRKLDA